MQSSSRILFGHMTGLILVWFSVLQKFQPLHDFYSAAKKAYKSGHDVQKYCEAIQCISQYVPDLHRTPWLHLAECATYVGNRRVLFINKQVKIVLSCLSPMTWN